MNEFISSLRDPDNTFLRHALLMGILASISFGIMGTYVVARRISYIAGAIAHCALAGIGLALLLESAKVLSWFTPQVGLIASGLLSALLIGAVSLWWKQREDTVIGAIWAIGMATGLLLYHLAKTNRDASSYLFGDITMVTRADLISIVVLDIILLACVPLLYRKFQAICFDEEFARVRGLNVNGYYLFLLCLVGLTVVLFINIVGMIMIIALLTLPAAIAGQFTRRLWQMMIVAAVLCAAFTTGGMAVGWEKDLPVGPTIILFAGATYLITLPVPWLLQLIRKRRQQAE
jgi:zinc transport system permease protein